MLLLIYILPPFLISMLCNDFTVLTSTSVQNHLHREAPRDYSICKISPSLDCKYLKCNFKHRFVTIFVIFNTNIFDTLVTRSSLTCYHAIFFIPSSFYMSYTPYSFLDIFFFRELSVYIFCRKN